MLIIIYLLRAEGQIKIFHFKCNSQILKKDQKKNFSPGHSEGKGAWEKKARFFDQSIHTWSFSWKSFFLFYGLGRMGVQSTCRQVEP